MPRLNELARRGRVGLVATVPRGCAPGAVYGLSTLLGYEPRLIGHARAPLEAAELELDVGDAFVLRLDLITIGGEETADSGLVLDHTGGRIPSPEARVLLDDLLSFWKRESGELVRGMELVPGLRNQALVIDRSGRDYTGVQTVPPRSILGQEACVHTPAGGLPGAADVLCRLIDSSYELLRHHEVNLTRIDQGLQPANLAWFWGQGRVPSLPSLGQMFGLRGVVVAKSPVVRGLARLAGWSVSNHPDMQGRGGLARAACSLMDSFDIVLVCDDAPDEASHAGDWEAKTEALERADAELIGPLMDRLARYGDAERDPTAEGWRMMVAVDHATLVRTRQHVADPVPVAMAGAWIRSAVERRFSESEAEASDMFIDPGHELLEFFLRGGLAGVRKEVTP